MDQTKPTSLSNTAHAPRLLSVERSVHRDAAEDGGQGSRATLKCRTWGRWVEGVGWGWGRLHSSANGEGARSWVIISVNCAIDHFNTRHPVEQIHAQPATRTRLVLLRVSGVSNRISAAHDGSRKRGDYCS